MVSLVCQQAERGQCVRVQGAASNGYHAHEPCEVFWVHTQSALEYCAGGSAAARVSCPTRGGLELCAAHSMKFSSEAFVFGAQDRCGGCLLSLRCFTIGQCSA
jgi:hypothetical protein